MPRRVLVAYAGRSRHTKAIATALVDRLAHDGLTAELADLDAGAVPPAADYEALVIGSCVRLGRNPQSVIDYILHSREALAAMPTFVFSIGDGDLAGISRVTGWEPTGSVTFDPLRPDRRRFLKRLGGHVPSSTEVAIAEADRVRNFAVTITQAVQRVDASSATPAGLLPCSATFADSRAQAPESSGPSRALTRHDADDGRGHVGRTETVFSGPSVADAHRR